MNVTDGQCRMGCGSSLLPLFKDLALPPPSFVCCWEPRPSPLAGCDREGLHAEVKLGVQLLLVAHSSTWLTVGSSLLCGGMGWIVPCAAMPGQRQARKGPPCSLSYLPAHRPPWFLACFLTCSWSFCLLGLVCSHCTVVPVTSVGLLWVGSLC